MVYKWDIKSTLLFLESYKSYPCLWNYKTDGYKDKTQRAIAMNSILRDLNIDEVNEDDIKRKIKTIRTRYTAELSRIQHSASSGCSDNVYVPTIYWFKNAEFLSSVCVPRQNSIKSASNITKTEQLPESNNEDSNEIEEFYESDYQPEQYSCETAVGDQLTTLSDEPQIDLYTGEPIKRTRFDETDEKLHFNSMNEGIEHEEEHEFDLFCKSLAVQLKKMPLDRALMCQEKLQSVMVQERLASIRSTRQRTPSSDCV